MSDRDDAPEPIDDAYVRAEALLEDAAARAARRARVLAAVARAPLARPAAPALAPRDRAWRAGGWLAAASLAGLSLFLMNQLLPTSPRLLPQPPAEPTAAVAGRTPGAAASTAAVRAAPEPAPASRRAGVVAKAGEARIASATPTAAAARAFPGASESKAARPEPAHAAVQPFAPPPPPSAGYMAPTVEAYAQTAPAPPVTVVVPSERRATPAYAMASSDLIGRAADAKRTAGSMDTAGIAYSAPPGLALAQSNPPADQVLDRGARLRAAAAAGRTAEVEALLADGAPVDAPDAKGDTALIASVRANHAAVAALLQRRGASLDRRNLTGESARTLAAARKDAELNHALGVVP